MAIYKVLSVVAAITAGYEANLVGGPEVGFTLFFSLASIGLMLEGVLNSLKKPL